MQVSLVGRVGLAGGCEAWGSCQSHNHVFPTSQRDWLVVAQKQTTSREILLWMTPSEAPKALQASECSELLDPTGASYWIFAQRQPGKFASQAQQGVLLG